MIKENAKYFCKDLNEIENYDKAVSDTTQTWHCHHRKETIENKSLKELKQEGLYYHRPPEELIFLTRSEHMKLHRKSKKWSVEIRNKMSESQKGKTKTEEHKKKISEKLKGKIVSDETRRRMSEAAKRRFPEKRLHDDITITT